MYQVMLERKDGTLTYLSQYGIESLALRDMRETWGMVESANVKAVVVVNPDGSIRARLSV